MVVMENIKNSQNRIDSFVVIVPVYNCEKVIVRTLDSICQSIQFFQENYPHAQSVKAEIVVVDDSSSDNTLATVIAFANKKANQGLFKIVQHKRNRGAGAARNTGVKHSQGKILLFCDGDDLFLPAHILVCFMGLQGKYDDINHFQISDRGKCLVIQLSDRPSPIISTGVKIQENIHPSWNIAIENSLPLNLCVKRQCHEFVEGFPEDETHKKVGGMEDIAYRQYLKAFFPVATINLQTVEYIRYPGNNLDRQMSKYQSPQESCTEIPEHEKRMKSLILEADRIKKQKLIYLKEKYTLTGDGNLESSPLNDYELHCQFRSYQFTQDWFSHNIPVWQKILANFTGLPNLSFLEIGSWEGRSTSWLLDNILTDKSAKITCIDTFEGAIEHQALGDQFLKTVESRFDFNVKQTGTPGKVNKIVGYSQAALRRLPLNSYDVIYIDGSHIAPDVLEDALLAWSLLKDKGIIIFDDYLWNMFNDQPTYHPKLAIDSFLAVFKDRLQIIHSGYQLIIEKNSPLLQFNKPEAIIDSNSQLSSINVKKLENFLQKIKGETYPEPPSPLHSTISHDMLTKCLNDFKLPSEARILDIGCGQGVALELFTKNSFKPVGITLNSEDVRICRDKGYEVYEMDQSFLDFEDLTFDFVWCRHCIEHSIFPLFTLSEIYRVLKFGGYLYVEVPAPDTNCRHQDNPNHYSTLGQSLWLSLIKRSGFTVLDVLDLNFVVPAGPDIYWAIFLQKL